MYFELIFFFGLFLLFSLRSSGARDEGNAIPLSKSIDSERSFTVIESIFNTDNKHSGYRHAAKAPKQDNSKYLSGGKPTVPTLKPVVGPKTSAPTHEVLKNTNVALLDSVPCTPSLNCPYEHFLGEGVLPTPMIDNSRKILMEWSPIAGCVEAVAIFLSNVGFLQNKNYFLWPHQLRESYFYPRCGTATPCMYAAIDWYRFKVVKNPYDRVVANYLHVMQAPQLRNDFIPQQHRENCTFELFLELLASADLYRVLGQHAMLQANFQEQALHCRRPPTSNNYPKNITIFHRIVKIETIHQDLRIVNRETGAHFHTSSRPLTHHYMERRNEVRSYVGDVSYAALKDNIPKNFGNFYNERLKEMASKIYACDINLYDYKFPYELTL
jgi:hypothetical protein